ncbi:MAG TPA: hypothetical protein VIL73_03430 [Gaiellaceae bacterium]
MATALFIAFIALSATCCLYYDPLKVPQAYWHRRDKPLVPYSFTRTFIVVLVVFEGGWGVLNLMPSWPALMLP